MNIAKTLLRVTVGALFVGHGTQKLFGWFGGGGPEATAKGFDAMGFRPARYHALAAGTAETVGGSLLTLGFLTPIASATLSAVMITAIRKVHGQKGVWVTNGGYEYNAVLLATLLAFTEQGPGSPSIDARLLPRFKGAELALLQLAAGAAGSWIATSDRYGELLSAKTGGTSAAQRAEEDDASTEEPKPVPA